MQFFKTLSCSLDWTVIAKPLEPQKCLIICSCRSRSGLHLFCQSAMKRSSDDCYLLAVGYTDSEVSLQSIQPIICLLTFMKASKQNVSGGHTFKGSRCFFFICICLYSRTFCQFQDYLRKSIKAVNRPQLIASHTSDAVFYNKESPVDYLNGSL